MVKALECEHCGQGLPRQLPAKSGVTTCPRCGGSVAIAAPSGNAAGATAVGAMMKESQTAKALAEALKAMEAKDGRRKGGQKGRRASYGGVAYELGQKAPASAPAAASPAVTAAPPDTTSAGPVARWGLTPGRWKVAACCVGFLVIGLSGYAALAPSTRQSAQHDRVLQLKQEADQLAASGKAGEAFKKYGQIVLLGASEPVYGSDARRAVEDARKARLRLQPLVLDAAEKAKLAKFTR